MNADFFNAKAQRREGAKRFCSVGTPTGNSLLAPLRLCAFALNGIRLPIRGRFVIAMVLLFHTCSLAPAAEVRTTVLVVVGAEGEAEYGKQFRQWAGRWQTAAERGGAALATIGLDEANEASDRDVLMRRLEDEAKTSAEPLWLVLIGHGTFDGKTARFNLRGPDVSAAELAAWLKPHQRPLAIVNCASASGPFINELSGPNRVVVAATKSGSEHNYARLGDYLSAAIVDPAADLDKDEQTSLLEAYLHAAAGVAEFYKSEARLATEHALLDDNGDRLGTPADWFQGVRAIKVAKAGTTPDGLRANQFHLIKSPREQKLPLEARTQRDQLEARIAQLRLRKSELTEEEYYSQLEFLSLELSRLYEQFDEPAAKAPPSATSTHVK
jgi:hypothetical protein